MTDSNKNLLWRTVSAVVLLPLVLVLVWSGPIGTAALLAPAAAILAFEFYSITLKKLDGAQILGMLVAAALPALATLWPARFPEVALALAGAGLIAIFAWYLLAGPLPEAPVRVSLVFTGIFYGGLLLASLGGMRLLNLGLSWIFLTLIVTWANDTGAYIAGRAFGKHKLYPKVSPAKTWEGFFGGMVASVAGALIAKATFFGTLSVIDCFAIAVPAAVLGPIGDLSESMLKRAYGAKDSGKLIPGHGGLLDRVDALLFTGPYVYLYALLS